jgi:hypothetical protein
MVTSNNLPTLLEIFSHQNCPGKKRILIGTTNHLQLQPEPQVFSFRNVQIIELSERQLNSFPLVKQYLLSVQDVHISLQKKQ